MSSHHVGSSIWPVIVIVLTVTHCQAADPVVVVGFVSQSVLVDCKTRFSPTWSWLGSKVGEMKSLGNGVKKHARFKDDRYSQPFVSLISMNGWFGRRIFFSYPAPSPLPSSPKELRDPTEIDLVYLANNAFLFPFLLSPRLRYTFKKEGDVYSLTITDVKSSDAGKLWNLELHERISCPGGVVVSAVTES